MRVLFDCWSGYASLIDLANLLLLFVLQLLRYMIASMYHASQYLLNLYVCWIAINTCNFLN